MRQNVCTSQRGGIDYFTAFETEHACCVPRNPRATSPEASMVRDQPGAHIPRRVIKGGSTCAHPTTACVTGPRAAKARRSTHQELVFASAALSDQDRVARAGTDPETAPDLLWVPHLLICGHSPQGAAVSRGSGDFHDERTNSILAV